MGRGRGRGGGRGGGRGEGGGGFEREDQYGGFGGSQDRTEHFSGPHKGGTGGGSGGSQKRHKGGDFNFQRQLPKFLQQYSHLIGSGKGQGGNNEDGADEDAPVVVGGKRGAPGAFDGWSDEDEGGGKGKGGGGLDDDIEVHALKQAMEDNPELAAEFEGKLAEKLNQAKAAEEKEAGNRAFAAKDYAKAVEAFTRCIHLEPKGEVYWSNRSAAHAALENWEAAAADARQAVKLKPNWGKAHHRLAVAFFGLKLYSDAVESYRRAQALEPDNQAVQQGLHKAEMMEVQSVKDRKHVFFNKKAKLTAPEVAKPGSDAGGGSKGASGREAGPQAGGGDKRKGISLSFAEEEEEA